MYKYQSDNSVNIQYEILKITPRLKDDKMKSKKQSTNHIIVLFLMIILFSFFNFVIPVILKNENTRNEENHSHDKYKILQLSYENLSHIEISIDGSNPSKNWSSLTLIPGYEDWFSGAGSWGNPYIIHDVYMDPEFYWRGCITIKNTKEYFQIVSCLFTDTDTGIVLENVINGKVFNNNCTHHGVGIKLINSHQNVISGNYLHDNIDGITLANSNNNTIYGNTLDANLYHGIYMSNCHNNEVLSNNATSSHFGGIRIYNSNNNDVNQNIVKDNEDAGIAISGNNNTLFENLATFNENGIVIGGSNCEIFENNVNYNNDTGIYCYGNYMNFSDNIINNNQYGIYFSYVFNSSISSNNINNNELCGIYLEDPENCSITNNLLDNCGLYTEFSNKYQKPSSNSISISNTINGKPVYFYTNKSNLEQVDFLNAGQILLFNCNNSEFANLELSSVYTGVLLINCRDFLITNLNTSRNNFRGLYILDSQNITLSHSTIILNGHNGVQFENCKDSVIKFNKVKKNNRHGIITLLSDDSSIINNTANYNRFCGIYLSGVYNKVFRNRISRNGDIGILLSNCMYANISENYVFNNTDHGVSINGGSYNNISSNIILHHAETDTTKPDWGGVCVTQYGINLDHTTNNYIYDNEVSHNEVGIYLDHSDYNVVYANYKYGILSAVRLWYSNYNNITYNVFEYSHECITQNGECTGNIIENNICKNRYGSGRSYLDQYLYYITIVGLFALVPASITAIALIIRKIRIKRSKRE